MDFAKALGDMLAGAKAQERPLSDREVGHFPNDGPSGRSWGALTLLDFADAHARCCGSLALGFHFTSITGIAQLMVKLEQVEEWAAALDAYLTGQVTITGQKVVALVNGYSHDVGVMGGFLGAAASPKVEAVYLYAFTRSFPDNGPMVEVDTGDVALSRENATRLVAECRAWVERTRKAKAERDLAAVRGTPPSTNGQH